MPEKVRAIVEHELALIADLRYEPYFLTVYDIVRYARSQGILCQGRGSAANSAVCYCLGITEVDPARMSVLFERFISKERNEPPDIDVDFEHQRREEVMQYIYARYGRHRAALTAALHTYRPKGALRDVGKALGLSLDQVDKLAKTMAWWDGRRIIPQRLEEAGFDPQHPVVAELAALAQEVIGFPRHLSQHSGGFVIARDRLDRLVPIENAAMDERTVIQWDKDDLDALGLLKIDVLALGMLSCVRRALDHVTRFRKSGASAECDPDFRLRLQDIPSECPQVYEMLCRGDSLGVFQVGVARADEHAAAAGAALLLRPGDRDGDRAAGADPGRHGASLPAAPAEARAGHLPVRGGEGGARAHARRVDLPGAGDAAGGRRRGLHAGRSRQAAARDGRMEAQGRHRAVPRQADQRHAGARLHRRVRRADLPADPGLRRIRLSREPRGELRPAGVRVVVAEVPRAGGVLRGAARLAAARLLRAGADRARCDEPRRRDAADRRHGERLELHAGAVDAPTARSLPCASASNSSPACRKRPANGSSPRAATAPFADPQDLARRAELGRGETNALAKADALATLSPATAAARCGPTLGVDADAPRAAPLAAATAAEPQVELLPPTEGQDIVADYHHTALTLRRHPLALLRDRFDARGYLSAEQIGRARDQQRVRTTGIVTCRQRPSTASGVTFITIEDETGTVNVVVWNTTGEKYRRAMLGSTLLTVYGHVERVTSGVTPIVHLIASRLEDHSPLLGQLTVPSRDFH